MKNIKLLFSIVLSLLLANTAFAQSTIGGQVTEIVDGKTVVIETYANGKITAELQYIEVPEAEQPFHQIAREHLGVLVLNQKVELKARGFTPTRTVGQLFVKGVDVGQQMIRDGAAWYAVLEKSGQDATQSGIYQSNEAQAKSEKRGVWSIADLKPPWQIRAEAEENRRRVEQIAQEAEAAKMTTSAEDAPVRRKPFAGRQLNNESQLLAASDTSLKLPPNLKMVGGLMVGYESSLKLGVVATPLMKADFADKDGKQALAVQIVYLYYDANESKGRQSVYLVCVDSESLDFKFLKYNDLIVTADNQKIVIGKAKRIARQNDYGVKEGLIYEVKKSVFTKIANAQKLEIKVGNYSRNLNGELQTMLYNLLQTSL
ncbi:MAG: thermonuclease family protein [Pyrinomonadaceae bacterium]|nr:thermonuclease family protein [Pyrinomonadaceae bacterium]